MSGGVVELFAGTGQMLSAAAAVGIPCVAAHEPSPSAARFLRLRLAREAAGCVLFDPEDGVGIPPTGQVAAILTAPPPSAGSSWLETVCRATEILNPLVVVVELRAGQLRRAGGADVVDGRLRALRFARLMPATGL